MKSPIAIVISSVLAVSDISKAEYVSKVTNAVRMKLSLKAPANWVMKSGKNLLDLSRVLISPLLINKQLYLSPTIITIIFEICKGNVMILIIDNYDSFTYNLVHLAEKQGVKTDVRRNDLISVEQIIDTKYDKIIISPGPCTPKESGVSRDVVKLCLEKDIPLFGVCLGLQTIVDVMGGDIIKANIPVHGKVSKVQNNGEGVFKGAPSEFEVVRYHSLIAQKDTLPEDLKVTAQTQDGIIMAVEHKNKNIHGVQFHPESILSEYGNTLMQNFLTN